MMMAMAKVMMMNRIMKRLVTVLDCLDEAA